MKNCPRCAYANEEKFATCVWCNRSLADVASTPAHDPDHPEHEQRVLQAERGRRLNRQLVEAMALYVIVIAFSVLAGSGYNWNTAMMFCSAISAAAVAWFAVRGWVGQLTAPLLQALVSMLLVLYLGLSTPVMFFSLGGHVFAAVLLCMWIDMIYGANR